MNGWGDYNCLGRHSGDSSNKCICSQPMVYEDRWQKWLPQKGDQYCIAVNLISVHWGTYLLLYMQHAWQQQSGLDDIRYAWLPLSRYHGRSQHFHDSAGRLGGSAVQIHVVSSRASIWICTRVECTNKCWCERWYGSCKVHQKTQGNHLQLQEGEWLDRLKDRMVDEHAEQGCKLSITWSTYGKIDHH